MLQRVERSLIWARGRSVACADSFGGMSGYQRERGRAQYALVRATGWRGRTGGLALLGHVGAHWDGDRAPCACARGSRRGPGRSWRPGGASRVARRGATHVGEPAAVYCRHQGAPRRGEGRLSGETFGWREGRRGRKRTSADLLPLTKVVPTQHSSISVSEPLEPPARGSPPGAVGRGASSSSESEPLLLQGSWLSAGRHDSLSPPPSTTCGVAHARGQKEATLQRIGKVDDDVPFSWPLFVSWGPR